MWKQMVYRPMEDIVLWKRTSYSFPVYLLSNTVSPDRIKCSSSFASGKHKRVIFRLFLFCASLLWHVSLCTNFTAFWPSINLLSVQAQRQGSIPQAPSHFGSSNHGNCTGTVWSAAGAVLLKGFHSIVIVDWDVLCLLEFRYVCLT